VYGGNYLSQSTHHCGNEAAEQPAEPDGRHRHGPCKERKSRAGSARGLAVRYAA